MYPELDRRLNCLTWLAIAVSLVWQCRSALLLNGLTWAIVIFTGLCISELACADDQPGFENAFSFPVSQATADVVEQLGESLKSETDEARTSVAAILHGLLVTGEEWIAVQDGYVGPREFARQQLAAMNDGDRAPYVRLAEPIAAQQLASALAERNGPALRVIAGQFPFTPSGTQAAQLWRAVLHDGGWDALALGEDRAASVNPSFSTSAESPKHAFSWIDDSDAFFTTEMHLATLPWLSESYANGRRPIPTVSVVPCESGNRVRHGLHRLPGDWPSSERLFTREGLANLDPVIRNSIGLLEELYRDDRRNGLTAAGRMLFTLEPQLDEPPTPGDEDLVARQNHDPSQGSTLGEEVWRLSSLTLGEIILGSPVVAFDRLWLLTESRNSPAVQLLSLDPDTGRILDRISLGQSSPGWGMDSPRQRRNALIVPDSGKLYCLPGNGALVVVDAASGGRLGGYRFPRHDELAVDARDRIVFPDLTGWTIPRRPQVLITTEWVICLAAESNPIHCLHQQNPRRVQSLPSWPGDRLLHLTGDHLLIDTVNRLRKVNLKTGIVDWVTNLPLASGRGVLLDDHYIYPTGSGGLGSVLVTTDKPVAASGVRIIANWDHPLCSPTDDSAVLYRLPQGIFKVSTRKGELIPSHVRPVPVSVEQWTIPELPALEQFDSALSAQDWSQAASRWREILSNESAIETLLHIDDDSRTCRVDRWLQGRIQRQRAILSPETVQQFDAAFHSAYAVLRSTGRIKNLELWEHCGEFPWVWQDRLTSPWESASKEELSAFRQQLEQQFVLATGPASRSTLERLVELYLQEGNFQRARQCLERWRTALSGSQPAHIVNDNPEVAKFKRLEQEISNARNIVREWPHHAVVSVFRTERIPDLLMQQPVARLGISGSIVESGRATLDWPGGTQLTMQRSDWQVPLVIRLPAAANAFRAQMGMTGLWEQGDLRIVQAGAEVFGILLRGSCGTPQARRLWGMSTGTSGITGPLSPLTGSRPAVPSESADGWPQGSVQSAANLYGQPIASTGPVLTNLILVRQQAMLSAIHPRDGELLWRRFDVAYLRDVHAEEHAIVLQFADPVLGRYAEVVDPLDGATLRTIIEPELAEKKLMTIGLKSITQGITQDGSLALKCTQLETQVVHWERTWPPGSEPFFIDETSLGIATPQSIEVINLRDGSRRFQSLVQCPTDRGDVFCTPLDHVLLIGCSSPLGKELLDRLDMRYLHRRCLLQGPVFAVDRSTGDLLWQREFDETLWPLDQQSDLPVLVLNEPRVDQSRQGQNSRLRVIDLWTGELFFEEEQAGPGLINVQVSGHSARQVVRIQTQRELLEFRFLAPPER